MSMSLSLVLMVGGTIIFLFTIAIICIVIWYRRKLKTILDSQAVVKVNGNDNAQNLMRGMKIQQHIRKLSDEKTDNSSMQVKSSTLKGGEVAMPMKSGITHGYQQSAGICSSSAMPSDFYGQDLTPFAQEQKLQFALPNAIQTTSGNKNDDFIPDHTHLNAQVIPGGVTADVALPSLVTPIGSTNGNII